MLELICTKTRGTCRKAVALLREHEVAFQYRDYKEQPLTKRRDSQATSALSCWTEEVLRRNNKAFKELGLTGNESDTKLIGLMAKHPTLLQRPIGVRGNQAVLGRPPEALLRLAG